MSVFYQLFDYLEDVSKLDPLSDLDLYCLHYVYNPKINSALTAFRSGWNNLAITTEHSMAPVQLFKSGLLLSNVIEMTANIQQGQYFLPQEQALEVPTIMSPLSQEIEIELKAIVNTLAESTNYGIELYV